MNITKLLRNALALIVGFFTGGIVNMLVVVLGPKVIPPPAGIDMSDVKSLSASVHLLEPKHFIFPFLAHAIGTFVGAVVAYVIAANRRSTYAHIVGAFFLAGGLAASTTIPAPKWFVALDLVCAYLPMAWLGSRLGARIVPERESSVTEPR